MHSTILAFLAIIFLVISRTVTLMYVASVALLVIGAMAAKDDVAQARGLDKVVALGNIFFALPLAVFSMEHFSASKGISQLVPKFMPWPMFWTSFVGVGLLAASLSIATKIQVRWSGLFWGIMMFTFVAMMDLPGTLVQPRNHFSWVLMLRELSFGAGGWVLAGDAMRRDGQGGSKLIIVGRVIIGAAAIFYGIEQFIRPVNVPGVPLEMVMPEWIPARLPIGYLTGAILLVCGAGILLGKKTRTAATYLGAWIALLVFTVYAAILIASFPDPSTDVKVEAMNYFTDTMLYAGVILAVARATSQGN
jgi:putative oxidoreductase